MKSFKALIPSILFILFELAFGILLVISPTSLTRTVLICFGIVLLILGMIYLIRYLKEKKQPEKSNYLNMPFAIVSLAAGIFCVIYGLLANAPETFATIIYGAIFIILGIYKMKTYNAIRKEGGSTSAITLLSGILSVLFGIAIIFLKSMDAKLLLILSGVAMMLEAVLDTVAVAYATKKPAPKEEKKDVEVLPEAKTED